MISEHHTSQIQFVRDYLRGLSTITALPAGSDTGSNCYVSHDLVGPDRMFILNVDKLADLLNKGELFESGLTPDDKYSQTFEALKRVIPLGSLWGNNEKSLFWEQLKDFIRPSLASGHGVYVVRAGDLGDPAAQQMTEELWELGYLADRLWDSHKHFPTVLGMLLRGLAKAYRDHMKPGANTPLDKYGVTLFGDKLVLSKGVPFNALSAHVFKTLKLEKQVPLGAWFSVYKGVTGFDTLGYHPPKRQRQVTYFDMSYAEDLADVLKVCLGLDPDLIGPAFRKKPRERATAKSPKRGVQSTRTGYITFDARQFLRDGMAEHHESVPFVVPLDRTFFGIPESLLGAQALGNLEAVVSKAYEARKAGKDNVKVRLASVNGDPSFVSGELLELDIRFPLPAPRTLSKSQDKVFIHYAELDTDGLFYRVIKQVGDFYLGKGHLSNTAYARLRAYQALLRWLHKGDHDPTGGLARAGIVYPNWLRKLRSDNAVSVRMINLYKLAMRIGRPRIGTYNYAGKPARAPHSSEVDKVLIEEGHTLLDDVFQTQINYVLPKTARYQIITSFLVPWLNVQTVAKYFRYVPQLYIPDAVEPPRNMESMLEQAYAALEPLLPMWAESY